MLQREAGRFQRARSRISGVVSPSHVCAHGITANNTPLLEHLGGLEPRELELLLLGKDGLKL